MPANSYKPWQHTALAIADSLHYTSRLICLLSLTPRWPSTPWSTYVCARALPKIWQYSAPRLSTHNPCQLMLVRGGARTDNDTAYTRSSFAKGRADTICTTTAAPPTSLSATYHIGTVCRHNSLVMLRFLGSKLAQHSSPAGRMAFHRASLGRPTGWRSTSSRPACPNSSGTAGAPGEHNPDLSHPSRLSGLCTDEQLSLNEASMRAYRGRPDGSLRENTLSSQPICRAPVVQGTAVVGERFDQGPALREVQEVAVHLTVVGAGEGVGVAGALWPSGLPTSGC